MPLRSTPHPTVAGVALADVVYPEHHRYPTHADRLTHVSVVLQGSLVEEAQRQEVFASTASVVVKPAGVPHRNEFGPGGARLFTLLPPPDVLQHVDGLGRWGWHHAGAVGATALRFVRSVRAASEDAPDDLWSLLAALDAPPVDGPRGVPGWILRARERLDDEVADAPTVEALAHDAGVHPVSLSRAFRRAFGCTPSAYRRHRRVRAAADLLASSRLSAAEVAFATGFADQSHLCREVRSELGLTPGQLQTVPRG